MSEKVKVLHFVDRMLRGGIQTFVLENIKHMERSKVQIDFLLLDDDKGTTRILANSEKGKFIIEELGKNNTLEEITYEQATKGFLAMFQPVKMNPKRDAFFKDLNTLSEKEVFEKYFPNTMKCKIEKYARIFLIKLGIYKPLLNLGKKVRKRD